MVLHKSRTFRTILDLSFKIRYKRGTIQFVNESTVKQAAAESMVPLGQYFKRVIATLAHHYNTNHLFAFVKIDLKDCFWRMLVSNEEAWTFCYVMPSLVPVTSLDDMEIVVPNSLQMGWAESLPNFFTATKTA